jgi:hypothetical protein
MDAIYCYAASYMDICLNDIKHCYSYINLNKSIFTKHDLMLIENDVTKINFFYDYVFPSLSVQIYMPSNEIETVSMVLRWVCYCPGCFDNQISFKKQNDFIQHLLTKHSHLIPKGGEFLSNPSKFGIKLFRCNACDFEYKNHIELKRHFKSKNHVSMVMSIE